MRGDVTTDQTRRLIASAVDTYDKSKAFYATAAERGRRPRAAGAGGGRHGRRVRLRPARQHRHGPGRAGDRRRGRRDRGLRRRRRHLDRQQLGGVLPRLRLGRLRGPGPVGRRRQPRQRRLRARLSPGPGLDDARRRGRRRARVARRCSASTTRGRAGWAAGATSPASSFAEVESRLADAACDADERIATMLVHDANLGREALARGCVDLVLGGHLHLRSGPTLVLGENDQRGYTYTTGTTGGAAYAIAIGSKPRRAADVSLVTYRDGRPVGDPVGDAADQRCLRGGRRTCRWSWATRRPSRRRPRPARRASGRAPSRCSRGRRRTARPRGRPVPRRTTGAPGSRGRSRRAPACRVPRAAPAP